MPAGRGKHNKEVAAELQNMYINVLSIVDKENTI
jgi:hypothetical protein